MSIIGLIPWYVVIDRKYLRKAASQTTFSGIGTFSGSLFQEVVQWLSEERRNVGALVAIMKFRSPTGSCTLG
jgi:hypothetical protein